MKRQTLLFVLLTATVLALGLDLRASPVAARGPERAAPSVKVDPRVMDDTADGQTARFLVILQQQVNTQQLGANIPDRDTRSQTIVDALRQTADEGQRGVRAQLDALGATYRAYWIVNLLAVEGDRRVVEAMAARADVKVIESNRPFRVPLEQPEIIEAADDSAAPQAGIEWNIKKVNAPAVWQKGDTGVGRVYANADTGVQWDHPALKKQYRGWNGSSANHNYAWWDAVHYDFGGGGNSCGFNLQAPCDDYGHGTHTMGTGIGKATNNNIGMAYGAKWIACRNMDDGIGMPSTYIECLQFFTAPTDLSGNNPDPSKKPDAVGNSYGCPSSEGCSANSLLAAVDNMRATGIFMSVSAGNSGSACSTVSDPPALYDSSITIGATDSNDTIASFSSRGPVTVDGSNRRKPDMVAPGVSVRSSYPRNTYAVLSGTSMASPHVAGAVVLLWSAFPTMVGDIDGTESVLELSAVPHTTSQGCGGDPNNAVPNNVYGYGRLDALAAYNYPKQFALNLADGLMAALRH